LLNTTDVVSNIKSPKKTITIGCSKITWAKIAIENFD
jgi:hypothetical protein